MAILIQGITIVYLLGSKLENLSTRLTAVETKMDQITTLTVRTPAGTHE